MNKKEGEKYGWKMTEEDRNTDRKSLTDKFWMKRK